MRVLVISDIHSNFSALDAVLTNAAPFDSVWCLGDLVGYGPDPNECVQRVRALRNMVCVMGNHDSAVSGNMGVDKFNEEAQEAILITKKILNPSNMEFLKSLPEKINLENVTLVHGSPRNPIWEYIIDPFMALINFSCFDSQIAFTGHTHLPVVFKLAADGKDVQREFLQSGEEITVDSKMILNPGSVGQPRDHDPRASYGIFDTKKMTWKTIRVEYNVSSVQKRILEAGFPERQSLRLAEGW